MLKKHWYHHREVEIKYQDTGTIPVYNLHRLRTSDVDRFNAKKMALHWKRYKTDDTQHGLSRMWTTQVTLENKFTYLGSSVSSTENDINTRLPKAWKAIDRLSVIWKSDLSDKIKCNFLQAAILSILLYGCTIWTITKLIEKKLDGNCTRTLRGILNKSQKQHPRKQQPYGHRPPISQTIQVRRIRQAGHCWRSKDKLINHVLLCTSLYGRTSVGRPVWAYLQQLCTDTGCSLEDLPETMDDRGGWRERSREVRLSSTTWWLYIYINPILIYIYIYICLCVCVCVYIYICMYINPVKNIYIYMYIYI